MRKLLFLSMAWVILLGPAALAAIHYVPSAYPNIQAGINAASNGDTVLVAQGVYAEHFNYSGKAILVASASGPEATIIEAVLPGAPIVRFENNEGANSILDGFTIRNSQGAPGVNISNAGPTIVRNIFTNNVNGNSDGGAINAVYGPVLRIFDNVFENNSSTHGTGGAVRSYGIDLIVTGNVFRGNTAGTHGGAIHLRASNGSVLHHNLFDNNHCLALGGALCFSECQGGEAYNNTVAFNSNSEPAHGAGFTVWYSSNCHLFNNIIVNNQGKGVYSNPPNNSTATYNDVWGNTIDYSGIEPGTGSISSDPLFMAGDSFELMGDSPCIDAGDPASPPDPNGTVADMGAFPFGGGPSGKSFDIADIASAPALPVDVAIAATGFSEYPIAGLEFHIGYRTDGLLFTGMTSSYLTDAIVNEIGGVIHIVWDNFSAPITVPEDSVILSLQFNVIGPNGSAYRIEWRAGSEVVDSLGNPVTAIRYFAGGVSVTEPCDLGGHVVYYDLERSLADVTIALSHDDTATTVTGADGRYLFENLPLGDYLACPSKTADEPGVTIADIIKIERHLAQIEIFDSPYKYIAADVNGSGNISMADVIKIRRYLATLEPLPAGNWAFVDSSYAITAQNWPQAPECGEGNLTGEDLLNVNLIGIRVGDVDNSWTAGIMMAEPEYLPQTTALNLGNVAGYPGDIVRLPLNAYEIAGMAGLELHFGYPSNGLQFVGIESNVLGDFTVSGGNGSAHLIWDDNLNTRDFSGGLEIAAIIFEVLEGSPEQMTVSIDRGYVVDVEGNDIAAGLGDGHVVHPTSIEDGTIPTTFGLGQNYPNPFNATTRISFSIPRPCQANLEVIDMTGRRVATLNSGRIEAGNHTVIWDGRTDDGAPCLRASTSIASGPIHTNNR